ncbi:hypothetical protein [Hymenobacter weizhouensis]|uniref:hypothetical protein n=1 Tax=Hymenobacter sp. YIM 151500-1 TaxID=2987689 RepID=UPI0022274270|nr:hypothetical protein [Hymenobacter sp. YIM 151500-1]UYZ62106.1 hypothetical protein OIS53_13955 [Hymenobacter sp. YIM 151500-1]
MASIEDRHQLAQLLAAELGSNSALREFLRDQALKQFDGDYDVLYQRVAEQRIGGETLEDIFTRQFVKQSAQQGRNTSTEEAQAWVQRTIAGIPLCQFSVPLHCEEWDPAYAPTVVALPEDFDDMKVETLRAFNQDGKEEILNAKEEPKLPVVVIGTCERVDEKGELLPGFDDNTAERLNGAAERLERYQIPDIGEIEGWPMGGPEISMQYWVAPMPSYGGPPPYTPAVAPFYLGTWQTNPSRNSVKNQQWISRGNLLYYWDVYQYGNTFRDIWVEQDPGPRIQLNLTVTLPKGVKITFNPQIGANDERMGEQFVGFNDPHWPQNQNTPYSPGKVNYFRGSY